MSTPHAQLLIDREAPRPRATHSISRAADHSLDEQLQLAGQIQNDLLPRTLPDLSPLALHTLYLPADFVSGDTYDITRLDEGRFSFSLVDATGHSLPAALLAILVKNSLRGKEIVNGAYRIIEPDELLARVNQELLDTQLQECHFITAVYAILDRSARQLRWARGGTPYPILFRPGQPPQQLRSDGAIIGIIENQPFEVTHHRMLPGDALLFYTDGLEALLLHRHDLCGDQPIMQSEWVQRFSETGPQAALEQIHQLVADRDPADWIRDDITALVLTYP